MARCNEENIKNMLDFFNAPCDDEIVNMDCNDYCEQLAQLAEQVAAGAELDDLLPELVEHMRHYSDCREEFEALVAVLKAERNGALTEAEPPPQDSSPAVE